MYQDISYQELSQPLDVDDKNGLYVLSSVACVSAEVRREKMTKSNPRQLRRRKLRYTNIPPKNNRVQATRRHCLPTVGQSTEF